MSTDEIINRINEKIAMIESNSYKYVSDDGLKDIVNFETKVNEEKNINELYNYYMKELNKLVGLDDVKNEIKKLINYLIFVKKTKDKLNIDKINLNMIFRGNPGTGKTTVAKIIANILCSLGFTKRNIVIETTPRDFIAGYVGQTAIKAKNLINNAAGGVIFIDEAYTFAAGKDEVNNSFAPEAITEIIKEMENYNTIFIFSGYGKEMDDFININSGIKSRIGYDISFKDYTEEELLQIFLNKMHNTGLSIDDEAKDEIKTIIKEKMKIKNSGNGRMIDNLYNELIREHATTCLNVNDSSELYNITLDSVKRINLKKERGKYFE